MSAPASTAVPGSPSRRSHQVLLLLLASLAASAPGAAGDEAVVRRLPAHVELTY